MKEGKVNYRIDELWERARPILAERGSVVLFRRSIAQSWESMQRFPVLTSLSVISVAVSLFLMCCILLVYVNLRSVLVRSQSGLHMSVYLQDDTSPQELQALSAELQSRPEVWKIEYLDKERALAVFREELGERADLLEGIRGKKNPLPASLEVRLRDGIDPNERFPVLAGELAKHRAVDLIDYRQQLVARFSQAFRLIRRVILFLLVAILTVSAWVVGSMIGLTLFSRRAELEVLSFCGATPKAIQLPFVLEGALQGFVGAVVSLFVFNFLSFSLLRTQVVSDLLGDGAGLPIVWQLLMVFLGLTTGASGAWFALRRFLPIR